MQALALDLATRCGYAYRDDHDFVRFGTWDFSPRPHNLPGFRFVALQAKLDRAYSMIRFVQVVYEDVQFSTDTRATQVWGGFLAAMQMWCDRRNVRYRGVHVATLKKHATGKGNADKEDMITAAKARGWNVADDNQADACWLLDFAQTKLNRRT